MKLSLLSIVLLVAVNASLAQKDIIIDDWDNWGEELNTKDSSQEMVVDTIYKGKHYNFAIKNENGNIKILGNLNEEGFTHGDWIYLFEECVDKSKVIIGPEATPSRLLWRCPTAYYENEDKVPLNIRDSVRQHIIDRAGTEFYESLKIQSISIVDWVHGKEILEKEKQKKIESRKQGGKYWSGVYYSKLKCNNKVKYVYRYKLFFQDSTPINIPIALDAEGNLLLSLGFPKKEPDIDFTQIISLCDAYNLATKKDASKLFPIKHVGLTYKDEVNRWVWVFINGTRYTSKSRGNKIWYWQHKVSVNANSGKISFDKSRGSAILCF